MHLPTTSQGDGTVLWNSCLVQTEASGQPTLWPVDFPREQRIEMESPRGSITNSTHSARQTKGHRCRMLLLRGAGMRAHQWQLTVPAGAIAHQYPPNTASQNSKQKQIGQPQWSQSEGRDLVLG